MNEQKDKPKKYCEIEDWTIVKEYVDPGRSGSNINRPSMQQLIKDADTGLYDAMPAYKLDRLSRSQKDTLYLIEGIFQKNNVHFISLPENFGTSTAFGKVMTGILSVFAQLEREQIKERTSMGRVGHAKSGKIMEFNSSAFGHEIDGDDYKVDLLKVEIVKRIHKMYLSGTSINKIKKTLNSEGYIGNKKNWSDARTRYTLSNPAYLGKIRYDGKTYDGKFFPIIDGETLNKTQGELKECQTATYKRFNMRFRPFRSKYMLSGLLRCGHCGATLFINSYVYNGKCKPRYNCPSAHKSRQKTRTYKIMDPNRPFRLAYAKDLEPAVINEIKNLASNPQSIQKPVKKTPDIDVEATQKELAKVREQQQRLIDFYVISDDANIDNISKKSADLKLQEETLKEQLTPLKEPDSDDKIVAFNEILAQIKDIDNLGYDKQKLIVKKLVKKIDVWNDNKIKIHWGT